MASILRQRLPVNAAARLSLFKHFTVTGPGTLSRRLIASSATRSAPWATRPNHFHHSQPVKSNIDYNIPEDRDIDVNVNPYKGGQGALDKAVHLFYITEIFRGALSSLFSTNSLFTTDGGQACGLSLNSSSDLHTPFFIRSRKVLCLPGSEVNTL